MTKEQIDGQRSLLDKLKGVYADRVELLREAKLLDENLYLVTELEAYDLVHEYSEAILAEIKRRLAVLDEEEEQILSLIGKI